MHLMVGIIGVTTTLVLDECKAGYVSTNGGTRNDGFTHSRLEAVRGAGISQRTRRPYLDDPVVSMKSRMKVFGGDVIRLQQGSE